MRRFDTFSTSLTELDRLFRNRAGVAADAAEPDVRKILADVRERGDAAILEYTRRWDNPGAQKLRVTEDEIEDAYVRVARTPMGEILHEAAARIRSFHERQLRQSWMDASRPGDIVGQLIRPLERVGIYVPGGTAAYPSTVLMTAIPAFVAGVPSLALATPPGADTGLPPDGTLAAARVAGVREVYAVGGAQAIASFAYGTEAIPRVDKIVGPGNIFVNLAKRFVYGEVGIDLLAGPSEIAVLADDAADPCVAAADILAQCEHDANCSALVGTPSQAFAGALLDALEEQSATLPRRDITHRALRDNGYLVVTRDLEEAAELISLYAPEHLHIDVREPWALLGRIRNAGAILIGPHTSASLGDYLAGPSHTLPTAGAARFSSPLNVDDFLKKTSLLSFDREAAVRMAPAAAAFAEFEGLEAHARAARRLPGRHNNPV